MVVQLNEDCPFLESLTLQEVLNLPHSSEIWSGSERCVVRFEKGSDYCAMKQGFILFDFEWLVIIAIILSWILMISNCDDIGPFLIWLLITEVTAKCTFRKMVCTPDRQRKQFPATVVKKSTPAFWNSIVSCFYLNRILFWTTPSKQPKPIQTPALKNLTSAHQSSQELCLVRWLPQQREFANR